MLRVWNKTQNTLVADRADVADTSAKRRQGLLKHTGLEPGQGLWISPCEAVHSFGMKFEIDVVYLDKKKRVLKIRESMKLWRLSACLRAKSVLELPAGQCKATQTIVGDELELERM
jgi:uncharacterized membrane protein (UPF0127 family)